MGHSLSWEILLCSERRKDKNQKKEPAIKNKNEARTEIERDFDRILFSTPVRRLADKTQVFPLDKNDSVRTRLTHSCEVSNLARSVGVALCYVDIEDFKDKPELQRDIPSLLAAIGLAHDLGNPPFGHQGESAIQSWFSKNQEHIFKSINKDERCCAFSVNKEDLFKDFLHFEGNAHTFRLVTKLQILNDEFGLNLTYATLAAMIKYPVIVTEKKHYNKHGFFHSEREVGTEVLEKIGLSMGKKHPLAYVMEACDDIAYSVLDTEDTIKKGLASFADLINFLKHKNPNEEDALIKNLCIDAMKKHDEYRKETNLSPQELNDISMQRFRTFAISEMISAIRDTFTENVNTLMSGEEKRPLLEMSAAANVTEHLKSFSIERGYTHKSVLALELEGYNTIIGLMDLFWFAILSLTGKDEKEQKKAPPFARYLYSRISENYKRIFEVSIKENRFPLWYNQCLLLTDMIAGMTDSYALNLYKELKSLQGECDIHV